MNVVRWVSVAVAVGWLSAGCAADGRDDRFGSDDDDGGSTHFGGAAASSGAGGEHASTCETDVPCTSDAQCVAVAGTRCNLNDNRCQEVLCGGLGASCSVADHCGAGLTCADGQCAEDLCPESCMTGELAQVWGSYACFDPASGAPIDLTEGCARLCAALRKAECDPADSHGQDPGFLCSDGFSCLDFVVWCPNGELTQSGTACP